MTLVTPAFLAGAAQADDDCDLRPATLRGLLRWWWRTMHTGSMSNDGLLRLESLLWGDTKDSSLIQLAISHQRGGRPARFEYRGYLNYGMSDQNRKVKPEGSSWNLRMTARSRNRLGGLKPDMVLDQARAALWLLCTYGGVGSKGRKGYGSLELTPPLANWSLARVGRAASQFRDCDLSARVASSDAKHGEETPEEEVGASSLETVLGPYEWTVYAADAHEVLKAIDAAYREAARSPSMPMSKRAALGLPRKGLRSKLDRLASPVHLHVAKGDRDLWIVRAMAFPSELLTDLETSRSILDQFLQDFRHELEGWVARSKPRPNPMPTHATPGTSASLPPTPISRAPLKRESQTVVTVVFLGPREKRGYRVQEEGRPEGIITLGTPPSPLPEVNSRYEVWIKDDDPRHPQYEWIDPKKAKKAAPDRGKGRGSKRRF